MAKELGGINTLEYWISGYGLSRHIMFSHLHYYLGPNAMIRPFQLCVGFPHYLLCLGKNVN